MIGAILNLYIGLAFAILEGFVNDVHNSRRACIGSKRSL